MKNVTTKFLQDIQETRNFGYVVTMSFMDGTTKVLDDPSDLMASGCSITTSAETSSFPLGNAIGKTLSLCLPNQDERWSDYDFYGCEIKVELTHPSLDSNIVLGYFTVIEPETYGSTVEISAVDKMHKFDKDFNKSSVLCPVSLQNLMVEACRQAGVSYQGAQFLNRNYTIREIPDNISCREIIGNIAMLAGGNAIINDYGTVSIVTYSMDKLYNQVDYDGGTFDTETTPYSDGDTLNGGDFTYSDTNEVSGGSFNDLRNYHVLFKGSKITLSTDDVIITGVQTEINDVVYPSDVTLNEGYILSISNPLLEKNTATEINTIMHSLNDILVFNNTISADHPKITGLRFRIFDIDHVSYPIVDFADVCYVVDRKNRYYKSIVTDIVFEFKGYTTFKCTAEAPARNSTKYSGAETKAIILAKELVDQEKTARELAIEETQDLINNSPGLYETITDNISGIPVEQCKNIKFKFNEQCKGEVGCDYISMYVSYYTDESKTSTKIYAIFERKDMTSLAGQNIIIPGEHGIYEVYVYFHSDGSINYWGWGIDNALYTNDGVTNEPYEMEHSPFDMVHTYRVRTSFPMENTHPYTSNTDEIYYILASHITETEKPMYYVLHNKPTMAESNIWWVASADVIYVSTDKGQTFNASLSADGNAIVNRLSAVGINADWIETGEMTIGGSGTSAKITMKSDNNSVVGGWDRNGVVIGTPPEVPNSRYVQIESGSIEFGDINNADINNRTLKGEILCYDEDIKIKSSKNIEIVVTDEHGEESSATIKRNSFQGRLLVQFLYGSNHIGFETKDIKIENGIVTYIQKGTNVDYAW